MKSLKCDLCEHEASGNSFEEWMMALMPHYQQAHSEVMQNPNSTKEDQDKWMEDNKQRFAEAPEGSQNHAQAGDEPELLTAKAE